PQQNPTNTSHNYDPSQLEKKRPPHTSKTKSQVIKTPCRLKEKRNITNPSSMQCMTIQRCFH
ncbi:MAG: hypothetical protein ACK56F_20725, partial [bacterium]